MFKLKPVFILIATILSVAIGDDLERPKYVQPVVNGNSYFVETFDEQNIGSKWIKSTAKKADVEEVIAKYDGEWSIEPGTESELEGDNGLVLKSKAKHHAISARLSKTFDFNNFNKPLVVQYEVKFQQPMECGGAYIKLLSDSANLKLESFYDKSPYSIMFGPDKCGSDSKLHFIIRFQNPTTGEVEEKHAKKTANIDQFFSDKKVHLYTLVVHPDNRYQMFIDQNEVNSGSLLTDFTPAINPDKEIVDPTDKKPETWDEREKIPDLEATKPDDWDENEPKQIVDTEAVMPSDWLVNEPLTIPDPSAIKPDDWDDDVDGEWEPAKIDNPLCASGTCGEWKPPMIDNPKYRGKWTAPLIPNPNYQGIWAPRKIPNPAWFEDKNPFNSLKSFSVLGIELWSMTENIYFDNFLITDDETVANDFAKNSWVIKKSVKPVEAKKPEEPTNTEEEETAGDDEEESSDVKDEL